MPVNDGLQGFWFKKFITIHDKLALEMNRCLQEEYVPPTEDQMKIHVDPKWSQEKELPSTTTDPITAYR